MASHDLFPDEPTSPIKLPGDGFNLFAQVVFDRPLEVPYTYAVPAALEAIIKQGARVSAPLGHGNKRVPGWCVELTREKPERPVKPIDSVLDPEPLVDAHLPVSYTHLRAHET